MIGQVFAPVAAYVVLIPLLLVTISLNMPGVAGAAFAALTAALVLGYELYLGHFVMLGVGPTMPFAVALPLALASLAVAQVWPGLSKSTGRRAALLTLAVAVLVALWIRFDPMAETIAVYSSDKTVEAIPITKPQS